jgi:hypothetical protein
MKDKRKTLKMISFQTFLYYDIMTIKINCLFQHEDKLSLNNHKM